MFTKRLFQLNWLVIIVLMLTTFSCSKDSDDTPQNPGGNGGDGDITPSITAINITNAGENGDQTVEGTIDENTKKINFEDVDPKSNLSAIQFNITAEPSKATLSKESYNFGFEEGDEEKTIVVKVVNGTKDKEYLVTISLAVAKTGGDFDNVEVYDYSSATGNTYPDFNGMLVRGSGFDGNQVLIVSRDAAHTNGPFLLDISDLKNGNNNPIPLNLTGVSGGIYPYNGAYLVDGHAYVINLATDAKIYYWKDQNASAQVIYDMTSEGHLGGSESTGRYGDFLSADIDSDGNGYIYLSDNDAGNPNGFGRLTVSNYTNISDPVFYKYPDNDYKALTYTASFNRVGNTDKYLVIGYDATMYVTGADGNVANADYVVSPGALPTGLSDARVIEFNDKRYLMGVTTYRHAEGETSLYVFDITKGDDIIEALENFDNAEKKDPVYKYSLQGASTIAPGTRSGFHVVKDGNGDDESLLLYAAHTDAGFAIIEVPKAQ